MIYKNLPVLAAIVLFAVANVQGFAPPVRSSVGVREHTTLNLFGNSKADREKEEQFRIQQEILASRRNPKKQKEYYQKVNARRAQKDQDVRDTILPIAKNGEDIFTEWKRRRESGKIKDFKYDDEPEGSIPLPQASFQIPKYDNGGRFDLRLPYVDQGWVDPESDVVSKAFGGLFKGGAKKAPKKESPKGPVRIKAKRAEGASSAPSTKTAKGAVNLKDFDKKKEPKEEPKKKGFGW
eukprot:CAMPEP_0113944128 /NCGR_PEP_ID=MMETSP1339-20121228/30653_1 /TAXON_ID=94617 /ORGANISM="Fibrocapsa japonica" /LENGTH=236 /DNA_ID=CAMNT_0000949203 /DNA_START=70 /DNA_END=777 /DNA_ORIENTATION=+ /assembly_acc=CAM_ASM_000762